MKIDGSVVRERKSQKMLPVFKQLETFCWSWIDKKLRGWKVRETVVIICAAVSYRNNAKQFEYSKIKQMNLYATKLDA